jgi:hypothetical protein
VSIAKNSKTTQRKQRYLCKDCRRRLCCKKNMLGHKNTERHFNSGGNIEEIGHESNLSANVAFPDPLNLSLPNHVHDLIPSDGPPRRVETEEAEPGIDPALYESVILLDYVIEVFAAT